jgi:anthranilate phosphoribosyltransferase
VLAGEEGPVRDIVLLNAAAGLVSWDLAHDATLAEQDIRARFREGIARAAQAIDSGAAIAKLDAWVAATTAPVP